MARKLWNASVQTEGWYFDALRNIRTSPSQSEKDRAFQSLERGFWYIPVRPSTGRRVLRTIPLRDRAGYTFLDFGCGMGRMLFLAAEYPFQCIRGIELREDLYACALDNVRKWNRFRSKCNQIEVVNMDAGNYRFPGEKLIVYMFNPFGENIMKDVLANLDDSIENNPRDILLILLDSDCAFLADRMCHMELVQQDNRCRIFRTRTS